MGKKLLIDCDYCGKEITDESDLMYHTTTMVLGYKSVGVRTELNDETGKEVKVKYLAKPSTYDIQFCDDCAPKFMKHIKEFFKNAPCADKRELA